MEKQHPHSAALDRLGFDALKAYFGITRQTYRNWRRTGIPERDRKTVKMLGAVAGVQMDEVDL